MSGLTLDEIKRIGDIPMNFVIGKERSGTTLLQIMLNAHPNIIAPPESRFMMLLYSRYGKIKRWTEQDLTHLCNDILREKAIDTFWAINKEDLMASFLVAKDIATYPLLCKLVFYHFSPNKDVKIFSDKNPVYTFFLTQLKELFPDATHIHIVRDYRANIVSHRRISITKQGAYISYRWMKMNVIIEEAKSHNKGKYFTVKYENLVNEPVKRVADICNFLGLPFYESMAIQHSSGIYPRFKEHKGKHFREAHQSVFTPINPSFIDNWAKKLTPGEVAKVEGIVGEYAEKTYGYKKQEITETTAKDISAGLIAKLTHRAITKMYLVVLNNPRLYFVIKKYIWKYF